MVEDRLLIRPIYRAGVDIPPEKAKEAYQNLVEAARGSFTETTLVLPGNITQSEVESFRDFYTKAAGISPEIFNQGTRDHLVLTARYNRMIGGVLNLKGFNFNLDELELLGLAHDIGRVFSHRRLRNDVFGTKILQASGFRENLLEKLPSDERLWKPVLVNGEKDFEATDAKIASIKETTVDEPIKGLIDLADILAKFVDERIMRWKEVNEIALRARLAPPNKETMWGQEYLRQSNQYPHLNSGVIKYFENLGAWFEGVSGIGVEDLVSLMEIALERHPLERI